MRGLLVSLIAAVLAHTASGAGFDPIRMVQERESRERREREKAATYTPAPVKDENQKRAERLAVLEKQIEGVRRGR